MEKTLYHLISMAEMPRTSHTYLYDLEDTEHAWTQEGGWLLLVADHVGVLTIGARTHVYQPWAAFVIPPGNRCRMKRAPTAHGCAFWGRFTPEPSGTPMLAVPSFTQLGEMGPLWDRRLRTALNRSYQMMRETRVVISDLLWSIGMDPGLVRQSPALTHAERHIEEHLSETLRVNDLAERVGVSHNQLIRIFQQEHGTGPQEYIRHRRQTYACRLLLETNLPIKQIADRVGIHDLAQFNRLVRAASGLSPRELRATTRPANLFRT
ncbi:MAG TPA: AraC family transcriptional regulator [Fimbriimonas sp.]|nr:AraC family transcriptional regulator [Fimbriimonas sp.]